MALRVLLPSADGWCSPGDAHLSRPAGTARQPPRLVRRMPRLVRRLPAPQAAAVGGLGRDERGGAAGGRLAAGAGGAGAGGPAAAGAAAGRAGLAGGRGAGGEGAGERVGRVVVDRAGDDGGQGGVAVIAGPASGVP